MTHPVPLSARSDCTKHPGGGRAQRSAQRQPHIGWIDEGAPLEDDAERRGDRGPQQDARVFAGTRGRRDRTHESTAPKAPDV